MSKTALLYDALAIADCSDRYLNIGISRGTLIELNMAP